MIYATHVPVIRTQWFEQHLDNSFHSSRFSHFRIHPKFDQMPQDALSHNHCNSPMVGQRAPVPVFVLNKGHMAERDAMQACCAWSALMPPCCRESSLLWLHKEHCLRMHAQPSEDWACLSWGTARASSAAHTGLCMSHIRRTDTDSLFRPDQIALVSSRGLVEDLPKQVLMRRRLGLQVHKGNAILDGSGGDQADRSRAPGGHLVCRLHRHRDGYWEAALEPVPEPGEGLSRFLRLLTCKFFEECDSHHLA